MSALERRTCWPEIGASGPLSVARYMAAGARPSDARLLRGEIRSARRAISSPRPRSARCSARSSGCGGSGLADLGRPAPAASGRARPRTRHADGRCVARGAQVDGFRAALSIASGRAQPSAAPAAGRAAGLRGPGVARRPGRGAAGAASPGRQRVSRCAAGPSAGADRARLAERLDRARCRPPLLLRAGRPAFASGRADPGACGRACGHDRRGRPGARRAGAADRRRASRARAGSRCSIDYGAWAEGPSGDTLQAVRGHAACDPLASPGEADLSAQVDFAPSPRPPGTAAPRSMARCRRAPSCARSASRRGPLQLRERASPEQRRQLRAALFRLTDPSAMGELFKVLVLASPERPPPPGFDAPTPCQRDENEPCSRPPTSPLSAASATASSPAWAGSARASSPRSIAATRAATRALVERNRALALETWASDGEPVHRPPGAWPHRRHAGRAEPGRPRRHADALVTNRPGLTLGVLSADCAPVLLADREPA